MPDTPTSRHGPGQPGVCEIRIKGHLGPHWDDWFDRMTITAESNGETLLIGPIADQSELHGLLRKIQDLGIPLISFTQHDPNQDDALKECDPLHGTEAGP